MWSDELDQVGVERGDVRFDALLGGNAGDRPRDVVRFEPLGFEDGDGERLQHLAHTLHLDDQLRGCRAAGGLIGIARFVAEGLATEIPGGADVRGAEHVEHADERLRVAVRGEGQFPLRRHERLVHGGHREKGAEEDAMGIEDDEAGLGRHAGIVECSPGFVDAKTTSSSMGSTTPNS